MHVALLVILYLSLLAATLIVLAGYAQYQVGIYTRGRSRVFLVRGVLALVGIALGVVTAAYYAYDPAARLLAFLAGFGAVHVPAAVILFVKRARGAGRT